MRELARYLVFLLTTLLGSHAFAGERVVRFALVIGNNQPEAAGSAHLRYAASRRRRSWRLPVSRPTSAWPP